MGYQMACIQICFQRSQFGWLLPLLNLDSARANIRCHPGPMDAKPRTRRRLPSRVRVTRYSLPSVTTHHLHRVALVLQTAPPLALQTVLPSPSSLCPAHGRSHVRAIRGCGPPWSREFSEERNVSSCDVRY